MNFFQSNVVVPIMNTIMNISNNINKQNLKHNSLRDISQFRKNLDA